MCFDMPAVKLETSIEAGLCKLEPEAAGIEGPVSTARELYVHVVVVTSSHCCRVRGPSRSMGYVITLGY